MPRVEFAGLDEKLSSPLKSEVGKLSKEPNRHEKAIKCFVRENLDFTYDHLKKSIDSKTLQKLNKFAK